MNPKYIVNLSEMIDILECFMEDNSWHNIVVGEMAGCHLFKQVTDVVVNTEGGIPFNQTLFVEGCQDYIGLMRKRLSNHIFYAEMFVEDMVDGLTPYDPFKPKILNPSPEYRIRINSDRLTEYQLIIVRDAHLIPVYYMHALMNSFNGKIISLVDPFDINGEMFVNAYTVVETMNKISPLQAMARSIYNVDSYVDRKVPGTATDKHFSKRQIGRIDDKQYITNKLSLLEEIQYKQFITNMRKHQKVLVISDRLHFCQDIKTGRTYPIVKNSLCEIVSPRLPLMRLKIHASKNIVAGDISYFEHCSPECIRVKPANILSVDESCYHRYNTSVLLCDDNITPRQRYSILKNSNNVIVGHF